jgi:hypothetical protein
MSKHHDPKHKHERHPDHDRDRDRDRDRGRDRDRDRRESGDDPKRHAKIIERRWLGSPPPTWQRYARALKQWHALPGAVVGSATEVTVAEDENEQ